MNTAKELDLFKKKNIELSQTVDELRDKIEFDKIYNSESIKHAKDLITELEEIRAEWGKNLVEIQEKSSEYEQLMAEVKRLQAIMQRTARGMKIPWHQRIRLFKRQKE